MNCDTLTHNGMGMFEDRHLAAVTAAILSMRPEIDEEDLNNPTHNGDPGVEDEMYSDLCAERSFFDGRSIELSMLGAAVANCTVVRTEPCEGCPLQQVQARVDELAAEASQGRGIPKEEFKCIFGQIVSAAATDERDENELDDDGTDDGYGACGDDSGHAAKQEVQQISD